MEIKVRYSSIDRFGKSRKFKTLAGARKFAHDWIGAHPEIGSTYAVSGDGIGKITCSGCTLRELFPSPSDTTAITIYTVMAEDGHFLGNYFTTREDAVAEMKILQGEGYSNLQIAEFEDAVRPIKLCETDYDEELPIPRDRSKPPAKWNPSDDIPF